MKPIRLPRSLQTALAAAALLLTLAGAPPALAQSCSNSDPGILLDVQDLGLGMLEIFFVSDFDPSDAALHPLLFGFSVTNAGQDGRLLRLQFRVDTESDMLLDGSTDEFAIAAGEVLMATNQDLSDQNSIFELDTFDISDAAEDLEDVILETGYLPEGTYTFTLSLIEDNTSLSECTLVLEVDNPRTIELRGPGGEFGFGEEVFTPFPQFEWDSQASRFNFRLCQALEGDGSGEEVLENQPVYELFEFETGFPGSHTLLYPPSAEELEEGETYCWQIEAVVRTSGGDALFLSDILCFTLASFQERGIDEILAILAQYLSTEDYERIIDMIENMRSTGVIQVDGAPASIADMQNLLIDLLAQGWGVGNVEIE